MNAGITLRTEITIRIRRNGLNSRPDFRVETRYTGPTRRPIPARSIHTRIWPRDMSQSRRSRIPAVTTAIARSHDRRSWLVVHILFMVVADGLELTGDGGAAAGVLFCTDTATT